MKRRVLPLWAACVAILLLLSGTPVRGTQHVEPLSIRFKLYQSPELFVRIEVGLRGSSDEVTRFEVSDEWGGVRNGGEEITNLTARASDGSNLIVKRPSNHRVVVHHRPGDNLTLAYDLRKNDYQIHSDRFRARRPIVNEKLFRAVGHLALLLPLHWDREVERPVDLRWEGFQQAGWQCISSWGQGDRPRTVRVRLDDVANALYLAGEVQVLERDIRGYPLTVSVAGDVWSFSPEKFSDLCAQIVEAERDFFDDFERPFYWISLVPTGPADSKGYSIGGTGLTNCFSMSVSPSTGIDPREGAGAEMRRILAHEMFHEWNGLTIRPQEPEELLYWFSEGFTDFYARRLMLRSGLIGKREYAESLSKALANYATNPYRDAGNERILRDFWNDADVQKLPYSRGDLTAMILDAGIRERSGGRQSLDDIMLELVTRGKAGHLHTVESLFELFSDYVSGETMRVVQDLVLHGGMPDLPMNLFGSQIKLEPDEVIAFDIGFDLEPSIEAKSVTGVRRGSAAHASGLRDGMHLTGWSVNSSNVNEEAVFTVEVNGESKRIAYLPHGESVRVYRAEAMDVNDMFPQWSHDGRWIAFTSDRDGDPEIYIMQANGSNPLRLTQVPGRDAHPYFSHDNERIVFQSPRANGIDTNIYVMQADGSNVRGLTQLQGFAGVPVFSPNDDFIAFQWRRSNDWSDGEKWIIWVMKADGSDLRLITQGDANDQVPNWSKDGKRLLFFSDRSGVNQIYTMNSDGSDVRRLLHSESNDQAAFWSPDNAKISFASDRNGNSDLYVVEVDGKNLRRLTDTPVTERAAVWSPDGSTLVYSSDSPGPSSIFRMRSDGSEKRLLTGPDRP